MIDLSWANVSSLRLTAVFVHETFLFDDIIYSHVFKPFHIFIYSHIRVLNVFMFLNYIIYFE